MHALYYKTVVVANPLATTDAIVICSQALSTEQFYNHLHPYLEESLVLSNVPFATLQGTFTSRNLFAPTRYLFGTTPPVSSGDNYLPASDAMCVRYC